MQREQEIRREILRKLTQVGPSYPLPESTLIAHVQMLVKPPPEPHEIKDQIAWLDAHLLLSDVPAVLGGLKYRITEAGKAEFEQMRT
jgi:hypothetical protein